MNLGRSRVILVFVSILSSRSLLAAESCPDLLLPVRSSEIPSLDFARVGKINVPSTDVRVHHVPKRSRTPEEWEEVKKVVQFANHQFERRGWSGSFLEGRFEIAKRFLPQSEYIYTTSKNGEITGTIGMTVARGKASDEVLTMEASHGWKLDRPGGSGTCAKIIEMRTYGLVPEAPRGSDRSSIYAHLWSEVNRMIHAEIAGCPELLGKDIVYTYGDATSILMYRPMGFAVADPSKYPPVTHDGTTWQVLISSPEKLLRNFIDRMRAYHELEGLPDRLKITTGDGKEFVADTRANKIKITSEKEVFFKIAKKSEVEAGIFADAGSEVGFTAEGRPITIEKLSHVTRIADGLVAEVGSRVAYFSDGTPAWISALHEPYPIPGTELVVRKGSTILLNSEGRFASAYAFESASAVFPREYPKLLSPRDGGLNWDTEKKSVAFLLSPESEYPPGIVVPDLGQDSAEVSFSMRSGRPVLRSIYYQAPRPIRLAPDLVAPEGSMVVYTFKNGVPVPKIVSPRKRTFRGAAG